MASEKEPGVAVIFNFIDFEKIDGRQWGRRNGSERDVWNIKRVFFKMGLSVRLHLNLNLEEFKKECDRILNRDFSEYASIHLVFMSHGNENSMLYCRNGTFNVVSVSEKIFQNVTLKGKPKYVIVEACRGSFDVNRRFDGGNSASDDEGNEITGMLASSYEGFISYLDPKKGSAFIQNFCNALELDWHKEIPYHEILNNFKNGFNNTSDQQCVTFTEYICNSQQDEEKRFNFAQFNRKHFLNREHSLDMEYEL